MTPRSRSEVSATTAAERLGLTAQSLGMWCRRPGAPVRIDGRRVWVQWPAFARWREQELARQAVADATKKLRAQLEAKPDGDPVARKLEADARLAELRAQKMAGALAPVAAMDDAVQQLAQATANALRGVRRFVPDVVAAGTPAEASALLQRIEAELLAACRAQALAIEAGAASTTEVPDAA